MRGFNESERPKVRRGGEPRLPCATAPRPSTPLRTAARTPGNPPPPPPQAGAAYKMPVLARDLICLAEHLLAEGGQKELMLVSHDWGGNLAWATTHLRPDLVSSQVVITSVHPNW